MDITFYQVIRIEEKLPEIINTDETPLDSSYFTVPEKAATDWQKRIGQRCLIRFKTVNFFEACERIFGRKPSSISSCFPTEEWDCYDQNGNYFATLTPALLDPFRYYAEIPSYVYIQNLISSSYCWSSSNKLSDGIVTFDDLIQAAKDFIEEYGEAAYEMEMLHAIMKAAFHARDNGPVYCMIG